MTTFTKKSLFLSQAPSFNFELNEEQILEKALDVGFVVKIGNDLYQVNEDYEEVYQDDIEYQNDTYWEGVNQCLTSCLYQQ